jgi:hypothetical protein
MLVVLSAFRWLSHSCWEFLCRRGARVWIGLVLTAWLENGGAPLLQAQPSAPDLVVAPESGFQATGLSRGPFHPSSTLFVLSNTTASPLAWSASKTQPWISISPTGGFLGAAQTVPVEVFLNGRSVDLPLGDHTANVIFTNLSREDEAAPRDVHLQIGLPGSPTLQFVIVKSTNVEIQVFGQSSSAFVVETSTNLWEWRPVHTNKIVLGKGSYVIAPNRPEARFYRAQCLTSEAPAPRLAFNALYVQDITQVHLTGAPGGTYLLEQATNHSPWMPLATNKLPASGNAIVTNSADPDASLVYRATPIETPVLDRVHHVLIVGQSLAIGAEGSPALTTTASDRNFKFYHDDTGDYLSPLFEAAAETIASSAANQASLAAPAHRMALSNVGVGGASYARLKKGTENYALGVSQFRNAPQAVAYEFLDYRPSAIFVVHGESDEMNSDYDLNIRQWQADYEADIRNVTGHAVNVPMFHSQISAWTTSLRSNAISPYKVLAETEVNPAKTILVCPKYFLPYALPLGLHLSNHGYRWLGQYYGKAYKRVVIDGAAWTPLKPASITRLGALITARFDVPVPPLVLDTNLVSDPGHYGFEYFDESPAPPAITGVEITDLDTVQITLAAVPTGAHQRLRYAYTGVPGNAGGPLTGPRGNLHDSDPEVSFNCDPLYNWCVHFDKPIQDLSPAPR